MPGAPARRHISRTSVVLRGSTVTLDVTQGYDAVWAAQGGIVVEDSVVEIQGRKDANGGLALYSDGDIAIRGAGTQLTAASTYGISAVQNMTVEAGTLDVSAYDGDAFQAAAMQISGGRCRPIPPRAARCAQQTVRFPLRGRAPV